MIQKNIPKNWQIKKLGDVTKVVAGFGFPIRFQGKKEGKYPFAKVSDMNRLGNEKYISYAENYLDEEDLKRVKVKTYPIGTVIFPKVGAALLTNKRRILNAETLIDNNIMGLIPEKISSEYLYYWMLRFDVTQHVGQGALPSINQSYVEQLELLLPPKSEQEKIATILTSVDDEIKKVGEIIEKSEEMKKGVMKDLLNPKNKPKEWEQKKLAEVCIFENGKAHENNIIDNGKYIVVNSKFIAQNGDVVKRTNDGLKMLNKNDITIVMSDIPQGKALGKCFLVDDNNKYTLNQRIGCIRTEILDKRYLFYFLNRNKYFLDFSNDTSQTNLKKEDILNCPILIPTPFEQKRISEILFGIDKKIEMYKKLKEKLLELKKGLMGDLLSGKVRVKEK